MWWAKPKKEPPTGTALLFPSLQAQGKGGGKPKSTGNSNTSSCLTHSYPTLVLSPVICPLKLYVPGHTISFLEKQ